MWSFSIKFSELTYKIVNNTFVIRWDFDKKNSQSHTRMASLDSKRQAMTIYNSEVTLCFFARLNKKKFQLTM